MSKWRWRAEVQRLDGCRVGEVQILAETRAQAVRAGHEAMVKTAGLWQREGRDVPPLRLAVVPLGPDPLDADKADTERSGFIPNHFGPQWGDHTHRW